MNKIVKQFQIELKKFRDSARNILNKETQRILRENPSIESLVLLCYTPGFNDGDPCVFSTETFSISYEDRKQIEAGEQDIYDCSVNKEFNKLINILENSGSLEMTIGNDKKVTYRLGKEPKIENYDCGH